MITSSLELTAFEHAITKTKSGAEVLVIPIESNRLKKTAGDRVFCNMIAWKYKEEKDYGTHFVKHSLTKDERESMSEDEKNALPILGNMKVTDEGGNANTSTQANNSLSVDIDLSDELGDDVPF